jgi:hypothetical protein
VLKAYGPQPSGAIARLRIKRSNHQACGIPWRETRVVDNFTKSDVGIRLNVIEKKSGR